MIELSKIASISGQGGLFKVHTALKNGVVMESMDDKKTKVVASATTKVSILSEISIYTTTADGSVLLEEVLKKMYARYGDVLPVDSKADGADLKKVLLAVLPEADMDRVYTSDIKKLVTWYGILAQQAPEVLLTPEPEKAEEPAKVAKAAKAEKAEEETEEKKEAPKKPKKKKADNE